MTEHEENDTELDDAADRASPIVGGYVDTIVGNAERQATEIRREAKRAAEQMRREALDSANRVLQRVDALERPLGELVGTLRSEVGRVSRELDLSVEAAAIATLGSLESEPETPPDVPSSHEPAGLHIENIPPVQENELPSPEQTSVGPDVDEAPPKEQTDHVEEAPAEHETAPPAEQPERETPPRSPAYVQPPAPPSGEEKGERRLFGLLRRSGGAKGIFITKQGNCAVCQKSFMAGNEENLRLSGWRVAGEVGVCPECQSDGWQLPDGARRPFRRAGA